jgi:hypothetical protein
MKYINPAFFTLLLVSSTAISETNDSKKQEQFCQYYAESAVEQNTQNKTQNCGFNNSRWNDNKKGQYQWCMSTSQDIANTETTARKVKLKECAKTKTTDNNPENQPNIPTACKSQNPHRLAVKSIISQSIYSNNVEQPVQNGLIRYDYNQDQRDDYVFIEIEKDQAHLVICLSHKDTWQADSVMSFYTTAQMGRENYGVAQEKDLLIIHINITEHNVGSAYRVTKYRYNLAKQGFDTVDDQAEVTPQYYDGVAAPMSPPITPNLSGAE